jgi:patatin-like phospholipase/acyl hydrolase
LRRSDGTLQGLRKQLPWPAEQPFRILSIDGGGIRGILPAAVLTELEERYLGGTSAGNYFDLIAGTSTGGIIALGLSIGLRARDIRDLYIEHGAEVFPAISWTS